ncbi:endonuclease-8 [Kushneria sinocarnis]|uniref:DNA-(apurinic or apyrimidinic site) lyase n=1 Tax=Kushneria sinocarnis TaxID=595502 RepID=A0A420WY57_9GAMM|nr:endonuclease VIII [Kushneria sinocarnis]RKR06159.1 endonuclease-8 [Kushneria sinocarnis]
MPEGPEIRRTADRLGRVLQGQALDSVWLAFESLRHHESQLIGCRVAAVDSWGKALLVRFANDRVLYSHNQLYGVWRIMRRERTPQTRRSPRVRLSTATHSAWLFSASDVSLWTVDTLKQHPFLARLGPDPLTHGVTTDQLVSRLGERRFAGRRLGTLLLDQGFLAGIGNYLRSEILFFAALAPGVRPRELSDHHLRWLAKCILDITRRAYRLAGVTNEERWRQPLIEQGWPRRRWRHAVFNREAEPCFFCGTPIARRMVASRRLYYCPGCQPGPI